LYDAEKKDYFIANDFIADKSNFWLETKTEIMFTPFLVLSSCIKEPELDKYAFNEYMWRYYIMSNRSMLKDVLRMKGASFYTVSNDKIGNKTYWSFPHKYTSLSFSQSVEKLTESMKESARVINSTGIKPIIEFTMGQDSRTVLSAFTNQKFPFSTAIYGKDDFDEVIHVKEMAKRYGFENNHIQLQENYINSPWESAKNSIMLSSADQPVYLLGRILHMRNQYKPISSLALNGVHGRFYKDGIWNEMYVMNLYREPRSFKTDVFIKYRALNKNYKDNIFNDSYLSVKNQSADYYNKMIEDSINGYADSPVAMQVDKFDVEHYAVFGMNGNNLCNFSLDLLSPLLFRRNLEFAFTLPANWRYNLSNIQRAMVFAMDPSLAAEITNFAHINMVPKTGLSFIPFILRYWFGQSKKFRDKLKNLAGINVKTGLQKAWDYLPIYQRFFYNDEVQSMLEFDSMMLSEILSKEEWNNFVTGYRNNRAESLDDLEYVLKLITVEYFLKKCNAIKFKA
jgi:hypothetical protein